MFDRIIFRQGTVFEIRLPFSSLDLLDFKRLSLLVSVCTFEHFIFSTKLITYMTGYSGIFEKIESGAISKIKEIYGKSRLRFNVANIFREYMGNDIRK